MLQRLAGINVNIPVDNFFRFYLFIAYILVFICRLDVSLILYVRGRCVDETGCLRAIGFLNQYNKVK